jgi:CHAT domain-containing protein
VAIQHHYPQVPNGLSAPRSNLKRATKARALQLAALEVMKNPEYRHPFYWSRFVLMGQGF